MLGISTLMVRVLIILYPTLKLLTCQPSFVIIPCIVLFKQGIQKKLMKKHEQNQIDNLHNGHINGPFVN